MYLEEYKQEIADTEHNEVKAVIAKDVLSFLFGIIGTTLQYKLTGEDAEFIEQCFQMVKQTEYEEGYAKGCIKGYRNCINDHNYKRT